MTVLWKNDVSVDCSLPFVMVNGYLLQMEYIGTHEQLEYSIILRNDGEIEQTVQSACWKYREYRRFKKHTLPPGGTVRLTFITNSNAQRFIHMGDERLVVCFK